MSGEFANLILFGIGLGLGFLSNTRLWAPLIYGFPRSLYWALRGWARWRGALRYLLTCAAWFILLSAGFTALALKWPATYQLVDGSRGFALGALCATGVGLFSALSARGRSSLGADFNQFMRPYLTGLGKARLLTVGEVEKSAGIDGGTHLRGLIPTPEEARAMLSVTKDTWDVIAGYGNFMEQLEKEKTEGRPRFPYPVSRLPFSKERIKRALHELLGKTTDKEFVKSLETGLMYLNFAMDDAEYDDYQHRRGAFAPNSAPSPAPSPEHQSG